MDSYSQIATLNLLPSLKNQSAVAIPGSKNPRQKAFLEKFPEGIVLNEQLKRQIHLAITETELPICIEGETGTGKEQIVKHIHARLNAQGHMPLVVINCANLKGDLAASTLFGHKKGAFTGAVENSIGAIGKAHNGLLFLDEFHRLDGAIQEQILRTLQDGSYQRVGDLTQNYSNFRLIIATPKSLEQHAMEGQLLMDLRFRLYGVDIRIPPLRERLQQMPDFIECFLAQSPKSIELSQWQKDKLVARCSEFYWQGNIRQLFGVLQTLVIQAIAFQEEIQAENLIVQPTMLRPQMAFEMAKSSITADGTDSIPCPQVSKEQDDDELLRMVRNYSSQPSDYEQFICTFEKALLSKLIDSCHSVKSLCEVTSMARSTLHAKRQRLGLTAKLTK